MSSDWTEMELGDFIELKRGYDLPKRNREDGDVPVISSSGESGSHSTMKVKAPGVITGRYGTIGEVFYIEKDFWPLNTTLYVKDFKSNDPLFVYYFLKTINYREYSDKAAVPGINRNHLHMAKIKVPTDSVVQRDIALRLWQLDQKIELNRQINQTLEQIAQAIFKSWFVDFDPVKAKIRAKAKLPSPSGRGAGGEGEKAEQKPPIPPKLLEAARRLRKEQTDAEILLWGILRNRQVADCKFRRQHPVGKYILDFYCHEKKLAIELDGGQHNERDQKKYDETRSEWLNEQGIEVLRFWNNEVLQKTESVVEKIYFTLTQTLSQWERALKDPVERAAMCAISGKSEADLDQLPAETLKQLAATADLFPDELVESEMGFIPKGWEVNKFKEIVKKYIDNRGKTPPLVEQGISLLEVKHLPDNDMLPNLDVDKYVTQETFNTWFRAHVEPDDILISTVGTIGRSCLVPAGEVFAIAQNILGIRFNPSLVLPIFMYYQMKEIKFKHSVQARLVTTVQASIKRKDLETVNVLVPTTEVQKHFESFTNNFVRRQQSKENKFLSHLRDVLLPRLLSGEIELKDDNQKTAAMA